MPTTVSHIFDSAEDRGYGIEYCGVLQSFEMVGALPPRRATRIGGGRRSHRSCAGHASGERFRIRSQVVGGQADSFLILVVLSLAAGVLLLGIAGRLYRLMHSWG